MKENTNQENIALFKLQDKVLESVSNKMSHLSGQILTLIEAVARDEEQRKALKDIIRDIMWSNPNANSYEILDIFSQFSHEYEGETISKIGTHDPNIAGTHIVRHFNKK